MKKSLGFRNSIILITILMMLCFYAAAQQSFRYKAMLDSVAQNNFYTIHLSPAIVAACKPQLEDIRIKNRQGSEMPYVIKQPTTTSAATSLSAFPLMATNNAGKIVLQNKNRIGTDNLVLFIKNTAATRMVTLSGSEDSIHWFAIKENIVLSNDNSDNDETSFTQTIQFPYSNYGYFQLSMQGKDSLPLHIFKAGVYRITNTPNTSFDAVPQPHIVQHDSSDKKSYIWLQFDNNYRIDKLQLALNGTKFYKRSFNLYSGKNTYNTLLATGNATSGDSSLLLNLNVKTNALLLVMDNLDNAPLTLKQVHAFQLPVYLIAYLNTGNNYSLFYGNPTLQAPAYDLQYFSDSIHTGSNLLAIKKIDKIAIPAPIKTEPYFSGWLLWSIIIAVLILLIYFSFALLKDINRKTTNTDAHL